MNNKQSVIARARGFADQLGLQVPVLLAPMAGACPASLSIAVANAGGMGACGVLLMSPEKISAWVTEFRTASEGCFQLNAWIPDPAVEPDEQHEARLREFLSVWEADMGVARSGAGPVSGPVSGPATDPATDPAPSPVASSGGVQDFDAQCQAMLDAQPRVISSIMGVYPPAMVAEMQRRGIAWFATATTVGEALEAAAAGADAIVAQGMEAGGHRGAFRSAEAEASLVGLFSLLPAIVDAVDIPVVATGGIADARGAAAALMLGASAVQTGTGFLRADESGISPVWADAIGRTAPEQTVATRAFSGRLGRSISTRYTEGAGAPSAPKPAPYPVQRRLTQAMRDAASRGGKLDGMQVWAGQSSRLAKALPAGEIVDELWQGALELLS